MADALTDAVTLALAAHDGANWDIWGKRRDRYWEAFEANLRAAAMTTSLDAFCGRYARKMGCTFGRNPEARAAVAAVLDRDDPAAVLRVMRERANGVTLRVRVVVDTRRALFETRQLEEESAHERDDRQPVNQQPALAGMDAAPVEPEPSGGG